MIATLIANAKRLASSPLAAATAIELTTHDKGWTAMCVWCLGEKSAEVHRVGSGDCMCCAYTGRDTLLVKLSQVAR